jgi:hypothetical protein
MSPQPSKLLFECSQVFIFKSNYAQKYTNRSVGGKAACLLAKTKRLRIFVVPLKGKQIKMGVGKADRVSRTLELFLGGRSTMPLKFRVFVKLYVLARARPPLSFEIVLLRARSIRIAFVPLR